jgi:hypothetical protein
MKIENKVIYNHLDFLTKEEQDKAKGIFETKFPKLQRIIKNEVNLIVTIKVKEKQGLKKQYFFFVKTESPSREFAITPKESDLEELGSWNIATAANNSMKKLLEIIQHKFSRRDPKNLLKARR